MSERGWLVGDGGPLIVLPSSACQWWDGAKDFENSLMNGGSVETQYDVICEASEGSVVNINGTHVFVGADCSLAGAFFRLNGHLVLAQGVWDEDAERAEEAQGHAAWIPALRRILAREPQSVVEMRIDDDRIRLLVGADSGAGELYGYQEETVDRPGVRHVRVFSGPDAELVVDFGRYSSQAPAS